MQNDWIYLSEYGISVRADGAVKTNRKGVHFGSTASRGYQIVWTKLGMRYVHRLVLEAFVGPSELEINHKNGLRSDNRRGNLEYCTRQYNRRDDVLRNGAKGCRQLRLGGKWQAYIRGSKRCVHLGTFDTEEEAHEAYVEARNCLWGIEA